MTERNLDLIRNVLLEIVKLPFANNGGYDLRDLAAKFATDEASEDIVCYHLKLLKDANYFMFTSDEKYMNGISWIGHDFIDLVRDPEAWKKIRAGTDAARGFTFDLVKDLAKGFAKKQIEKHTGIEL
jgi:Hypothetical protein (DUF2513)